MNLRFKKLHEDAILPTRAHEGDAGLDLYAADYDCVYTGEVAAVSTGIAVEIPHGYVGLIHPRSGLAAKHGITVVNAPGTIDAGYRGEVKVLLTSMLSYDDGFKNRHAIQPGDRIAQLVVQKVELPEPVWVDKLPDADRGDGGFGSTGA